MSSSELDILKKLFSCSSEYVVIMNYDFEVLWCNKEKAAGFLNFRNLRQIFENVPQPLASREYYSNYNGMEFSCRIINYPESGLYVLQTSGEDTIFGCMKSDAVRHFFSNQTGQLRETAAGIASVVTLVRNTLDEESLEQIDDYLDIAVGKCRSILKAALHPEELIKYVENVPEPSAVDLTGFLYEFQRICSGILKKQIKISLTAAPGLCVSVNPDRLTVCMLSLTVLAGKSISDCGNIFISADRSGDYVSVTVSSESKENTPQERLFSKFEKLYKEEEADPDLFIVYRFCRAFNGIFMIADNTQNEGKTYSMKFPYHKDNDSSVTLKSEPSPYHGELFSIYNIALSEISDII